MVPEHAEAPAREEVPFSGLTADLGKNSLRRFLTLTVSKTILAMLRHFPVRAARKNDRMHPPRIDRSRFGALRLARAGRVPDLYLFPQHEGASEDPIGDTDTTGYRRTNAYVMVHLTWLSSTRWESLPRFHSAHARCCLHDRSLHCQSQVTPSPHLQKRAMPTHV